MNNTIELAVKSMKELQLNPNTQEQLTIAMFKSGISYDQLNKLIDELEKGGK